MKRLWALGLSAVAITAAAVFLASPAGGISIVGHFVDDNGHLFENDIDAIAEAGITKGCNPPANTRYCPTNAVDRGAMAALLRRAFDLPSGTADYFIDDNGSIFEHDINAIAEAGITKGCNPPSNNRYCPGNIVDRGAMAAFLQRGLGLPYLVLQIPPRRSLGALVLKRRRDLFNHGRCGFWPQLSRRGRTFPVRTGVGIGTHYLQCWEQLL